MDKKIIFSLLGNALTAFSLTFAAPVAYSAVFMRSFWYAVVFAAVGILTFTVALKFRFLAQGHRRRLPLTSAAVALILIYPTIAVFAALPFLYFGYMSPLDSVLETVSDLTSAGISLLPSNAPYALRLWQSLLMWFGSLLFLVMLVSVMPEASGSFGMTLSLPGKQNFSPIFGQMLSLAARMIKVYTALTIFSVILFKLAGLDIWDSLLMAMRCISTGGGDYFPARENLYVGYAAAFTMILACGNFLFFYRLIITAVPPIEGKRYTFSDYGRYFRVLLNNILRNAKRFFSNTEVAATIGVIFLGVGLISFRTYVHEDFFDFNVIFRQTFFHVASFLSTTGIHLETFGEFSDFDKFLIYLMAIFGGCMGSVTGGLKMMRVIILVKEAAAELTKTIHPRMLVVIKVNKISVPSKIVGRILGFFFLACVTLFLCAAVLSLTGLKFSEAVAMSFACLTNLGIVPGLCESHHFLALPAAGEIFCMLILVTGRLEIFVLLIFVAGLINSRKSGEWH